MKISRWLKKTLLLLNYAVVHEEVYSVSFSVDNSLSIPGENGEVSLTFGDDKDDLFDPYDNVVYLRFIRNDLDLTTRVSCEEEGKGEYSFFIAFSDPVDDPADQAFSGVWMMIALFKLCQSIINTWKGASAPFFMFLETIFATDRIGFGTVKNTEDSWYHARLEFQEL